MGLMEEFLHPWGQSGSGGGGGGDFVVTLLKSTDDDGWVATKTFAKTLAAMRAGRTVMFQLLIGDTLYQMTDVLIDTLNGNDMISARSDGIGEQPDKIFIIWDGETLYVTGRYTRQAWITQDYNASSASVPGSYHEGSVEFYFGELSALTITEVPPTEVRQVYFQSGATPTVLTLPQGILGLDGFTPAANTEYVLEFAFGVGYVGIPVSEDEDEEEEEET